MADKVTKKLHYRRADWTGGRYEGDLSLEQVLSKNFNNPRQMEVDDSNVVGGLKFRATPPHGFFGHIGHYTRDRKTSIVPQQIQDQDTETEVLAPPKGFEFLDGEVFFLVRGDHLVYCANRAREGLLKRFLQEFIRDEPHISTRMRLASAIPGEYRGHLQEGVKRIVFETSVLDSVRILERDLYPRDYDGEDGPRDRDYRSRNRRALLNAISQIFGMTRREAMPTDPTEDFSLELVVKYSGSKKAAKRNVAYEKMGMLAEDLSLISEGTNSFEIETQSGLKIEDNQLRIHEDVRLPIHGSSVDYYATWQTLLEFLDTQIESGRLQ